MTVSRQTILHLLVLILLVSACGAEQQALPTEIDLPTDIPPTETEIVEDTATPTPVINPTLPPTWTNTPEPSETPAPTETEVVDTLTPSITPRVVPEVCDVFSSDPERTTREFIVGESPVVAWTPVEGAELYRVFLYEFSGKLIKDDIYVAETSFTLDPNSFELGEFYLWSVWPLDAIGDQMCFERGGELVPQRQPINSGG